MQSFIDTFRRSEWLRLRTADPSNRFLFRVVLPSVVGVTIGMLLFVSPWVALVCILGIALFVMALIRPVILCYLTVLAIAWTSGTERGKPFPMLRTNEIILAVSLGIAFIIIMVRKNRFPVKFGSLGIGTFVLVMGTSIIPGAYYLVRGAPLSIEDAIVLLSSFQYVLLFWMFAYIPASNRERLAIVKFMLFCAAVVALVGLLQGARVSVVNSFLANWYASPHQAAALRLGRITSLLGSWNTLGIFMMVNLLIIWAFGISRPADFGWPAILTSGGLCIACLLLSGSFAGMINLLLGAIIIAVLLGMRLSKRNIILFFLMVAVISVTFLLFPEIIQSRFDYQFGYGGPVPATLVERFRLWKDIYLPAIQQNLLWGINPTIPTYYSWQYTESQFLSLLFSFGIVGFTAYLVWNILAVNFLFHKLLSYGGFIKTISAVAAAFVIVLFVAGLSNAVFTYSGTADYLWIILGMTTTTEGLVQEPLVGRNLKGTKR